MSFEQSPKPAFTAPSPVYRKRKEKGPATQPNQYAGNHETKYKHMRCVDARDLAEQIRACSRYGPRPSCKHCHGTGFAGIYENKKMGRAPLACACLFKPPTGAQIRKANKSER